MLAVKSVINLSSTLPIRLMLVIKAKHFSFAVLPMLKRRDLRLPYGVVTLAQSLFEHLFDATQLAIFSPNQSDFIKNPYRSFVTSQHSFFLQLIDVQHLTKKSTTTRRIVQLGWKVLNRKSKTEIQISGNF
jgi:hypothetical protein